MSARERIVVRGAPRQQDLSWGRRRLERGEPTFFEPWVEAIAEYGCQFTVPPAGAPTLEGITGLLTDAQGTYRGSRLFGAKETSSILPRDVRQLVERAAERIQQAGYFGPLGIDVMQYRGPAGEIAWRALQDINARLTMGRVALGLRSLVAPHEIADWLHVRWSAGGAEGDCARLAASLPAEARVVRLSPLEIGGHPASRGTVLVVAGALETLNRCFKLVFPD
jgi:hypothetical protein